jgi:hypothetical protein
MRESRTEPGAAGDSLIAHHFTKLAAGVQVQTAAPGESLVGSLPRVPIL